MIVDCHTHVNLSAGEAEVSEHLEAAETVGVCIVLATLTGPSEEVNKSLADYVGRHREKMIGFAVVEPTEDKIGSRYLAAETHKQGLKGIVLYCAECGFHPAHSRAMRLYELAEELGLPVFFHNGGPSLGHKAILDYAQPYLLDEIARTFGDLKIIIGSMGLPFLEQTLAMAAKHENVYADLTIRPSNVWQIYNTLVAAYERGVMHKLLFGSGFPEGSATECIETLFGFNILFADTNLPTVPRGHIRAIIERDTLDVLGIEHKDIKVQEHNSLRAQEHNSVKT